MKRAIVFMCMLFFIAYEMCGCSCLSGSSNSTSTSYSGETTEETEEETKESVTANGIVVPPDITETTAINIPTWDVLYNNTLNVKFKFDGENKSYFIKAPVSGNYRFSFDVSDVTCSYCVELSKTNREMIESTNNDNDFNAELTKGETYVLKIIQDTGLPECTIKIGIPNSIKTIENNKIEEKLRFIGQEDTYIFTAELSGKYGIQLDISNVEYSYSVKVINSKKEIIASGNYYDLSSEDYYLNADLEENQKYEIIVNYDDDVNDDDLKYKIKIYNPNIVKYLNGNTVSGNFTFGGQQDIYKFSAPSTSTFILEFDDSNEELEYEISFCDKKNHIQGPKEKNNWRVSFDLEKGMEYKITVSQNDNYGKYKFYIVKEITE